MFILSILERSVTDEKLAVILALAGAACYGFKNTKTMLTKHQISNTKIYLSK